MNCSFALSITKNERFAGKTDNRIPNPAFQLPTPYLLPSSHPLSFLLPISYHSFFTLFFIPPPHSLSFLLPIPYHSSFPFLIFPPSLSISFLLPIPYNFSFTFLIIPPFHSLSFLLPITYHSSLPFLIIPLIPYQSSFSFPPLPFLQFNRPVCEGWTGWHTLGTVNGLFPLYCVLYSRVEQGIFLY